MASSSTLWRIIPLLAAVGAGIGVVAIVLDADGLVDTIADAVATNEKGPTNAVQGVFDGKDLQRGRYPAQLVPVATELSQPTDIQAIPGHPNTLVVLQKTGAAQLVNVESGTVTPWWSVKVQSGSEMGLLGIAFAADFGTSGRFYVHHNPPSGKTGVVSAWRCNPDTLKDPVQVAQVLEADQPWKNHDGGQLLTGPDGALYIAFGDGGAGNDPQGNGQNGKAVLGTVLRIQPREQGGYDVPPDNPFVGNPDMNPAIYAWGLRNPWRMTFTDAGQLVVADVGQDKWEEVDLVDAGANLGWAAVEGRECRQPPCEAYVPPVWVYGRDDGVSVTGGVIIGAKDLPGLEGRYLVGDFGTGRIWALNLPEKAGMTAAEPMALGRFRINPSTFGKDSAGRVYVADFSGGVLYRLAAKG